MEPSPRNLKKKQLLAAAKERVFSLGIRDLASALSYENMIYGLAKMMWAMDSRDAYCVFGPDATITRSISRWMSGFGYGNVIRWKEGFIFPEMRPNGCGTILVRMDELPKKMDIFERIYEIKNSETQLDGIPVIPNFGVGNHFFELYKPQFVSPEVKKKIRHDSYYAILHSSAQGDIKEYQRFGLETAEDMETPAGSIKVLKDGDAKEYWRLWEKFSDFSTRRREFLAREVLGDVEIVANHTHQGMFAPSEIRLGSYDTMENGGGDLFPVAMRWDVPVYIIKGQPNLSKEILSSQRFKKRAKDVGVFDGLKNINLLPHGGGYSIEMPYTRIKVIESKIGNHFVLKGVKPVSRVSDLPKSKKSGVSEFGEMVIMNPFELPYHYRGTKVVEKIMEYDLGPTVATLQPLSTLKV